MCQDHTQAFRCGVHKKVEFPISAGATSEDRHTVIWAETVQYVTRYQRRLPKMRCSIRSTRGLMHVHAVGLM